jgi:hypothetical protein
VISSRTAPGVTLLSYFIAPSLLSLSLSLSLSSACLFFSVSVCPRYDGDSDGLKTHGIRSEAPRRQHGPPPISDGSRPQQGTGMILFLLAHATE